MFIVECEKKFVELRKWAVSKYEKAVKFLLSRNWEKWKKGSSKIDIYPAMRWELLQEEDIENFIAANP